MLANIVFRLILCLHFKNFLGYFFKSEKDKELREIVISDDDKKLQMF